MGANALLLDPAKGRDLLVALAPELILVVWALLLTLHAAWRHKDPGAQRQVGWLSLVGTIGAAVTAIWLWKRGAYIAGPYIIAMDAFRWGMTVTILAGVALSTVVAIFYLDREAINIPEYHVLVLFAAVGMLFMVNGADLLVIFLGLETMSVAIYVLAGINRRSPFAAEAALKYFLLGAFASAFLLYGIALLYGASGSTQLLLIGQQAGFLEDPGLRFMFHAGVALLFVGLGFKVAAVPFHMWAPDVYDGAPTPATMFMAATVKTAAFAALARVVLVALPGIHDDWSGVLWWLAASTMVVGNLVALAQRTLKRMLAYSSIAHAGYLLAALVAGSGAGAGAVTFYMMFYTLATVASFSVVIALGRQGERDVTLDDLAGLSESHPMLALVMAVSMLSLMGFPGTAGFVGKWYILAAATGGKFTTIAVVLVLTSVVSAGYYLPVIMAMYMKPRLHDRSHQGARLPAVVQGMLVLALAATVVFGIWPGRPLLAARLAANGFVRTRTTAVANPAAAPPQPAPPPAPER